MSLARLLATGKSLVGTKSQAGRYQLSRQRLLPKFGSAKNPFRVCVQEEETQSGAMAPQKQAEESVRPGQARKMEHEPETSPPPTAQRAPQIEPLSPVPFAPPLPRTRQGKHALPLVSVCAWCFPGRSWFLRHPGLAGAVQLSHGICSRHLRELSLSLGGRSASQCVRSSGPQAQASQLFGAGEPKPGRLSRLIRALFARRPKRQETVALARSRLPVQGELSLDTVKVVRNDLRDADWELAPSKLPPSKQAKASREPEPGGQRTPAKDMGPAARHASDASRT